MKVRAGTADQHEGNPGGAEGRDGEAESVLSSHAMLAV
ncbi:hypothetical protein OICFNHDK_3831 [Methylobacterium bullatum]|uniref:Uncharacterized protein n=1 Tax=Methylobacterium bullatum TaxID=570505 RepID=A0AAV4ZC45_9HYPH|nr:hypothetical protein OICFNHDK_3831 [Methylobacterium bullatum]